MNTKNHEHAVDVAEEWASRDLSQVPVPDRDEQARMLAELPDIDPDTAPMVSRSLRLPPELDQQIKEAAREEGVSTSDWMRDALVRVLAAEDSGQVSLEQAIEALRRLPHSA